VDGTHGNTNTIGVLYIGFYQNSWQESEEKEDAYFYP